VISAPASDSYIRQKLKSCDNVGMRHEHIHLKAETKLEELLSLIDDLNADADVSGFIVQLPLPPALQSSADLVTQRISPAKDVDGFGATNLGTMLLGVDSEKLAPATPSGVVAMLEHYSISVEGKHVASGPQFRFTVYIQLIKTGYQHLFLQIQSNTVEISFPLSIVTPEGESYLANNLEELTKAVHEIIARPRTKEMVEHLLKNSSRHKK
jgi:hypothetical protein